MLALYIIGGIVLYFIIRYLFILMSSMLAKNNKKIDVAEIIKILDMNKKKKCRMCERELLTKSTDGLCAPCHLQLCLDPIHCKRCFNLLNKLMDFMKKDEEEENNE